MKGQRLRWERCLIAGIAPTVQAVQNVRTVKAVHVVHTVRTVKAVHVVPTVWTVRAVRTVHGVLTVLTVRTVRNVMAVHAVQTVHAVQFPANSVTTIIGFVVIRRRLAVKHTRLTSGLRSLATT